LKTTMEMGIMSTPLLIVALVLLKSYGEKISQPSTFIKRERYLRQLPIFTRSGQPFHRAKTLMLFIKLDITTAFDSVRGEYLLKYYNDLGLERGGVI
jgi:hypothetical protein